MNQRIYLHDDEGHYVDIDECPFDYDATFEYFVIDFFGHYRNQICALPPLEWPVWLKDAIAHLSRIVNMDDEAERMKQQIGM